MNEDEKIKEENDTNKFENEEIDIKEIEENNVKIKKEIVV